MSNILHFPKTKTTSASKGKSYICHVIRQYAAMPAYVTRNATLNRVVTNLQQKGWTIEARPDGEIICHHPKIVTFQKIPLIEANRLQRAADAAEKKA